MKKKLVTLLIIVYSLFTFPQPMFYSGTQIIIAKTLDTIIVASDSKITKVETEKTIQIPDLNKTNVEEYVEWLNASQNDIEETYAPYSKIRIFEDIGVAFGGLTIAKEEFKIYTIDVIEQACRLSGNIFEKATKVEKDMKSFLVKLWEKANYLDLKAGKLNSQVALFGFNKDTAIVIAWIFSPEISPLGKIGVKAELRQTNSETVKCSEIYKMGIDKSYHWFCDELEIKELIVRIKKGIQNCIDIFPECGEPIKLLVMDKDGWQWL